MNKANIIPSDVLFIDVNNYYEIALRASGFKVSPQGVEAILNIIKTVDTYKGSVNLADIAIIETRVTEMFTDTESDKEESSTKH